MNITFHGAARNVTGSKHLVRLNDGTGILLDCGMFQGMGEQTEDMNEHFGFNPQKVDYMILSHAHIDHCGGLVGDNGSFNFPNAQYFIGEPDFAYWTDDSKIPANYPARPHFLAQAQKNLLPVKDRIHFYKDNEEILPGITVLSAPGHTVSHSIFMINSGGKQLCYVGDLAHHPVLLLEHPRTQFAFDTDPAQSARTRMCTAVSLMPDGVRAGRLSSAPLTVDADQMQRAPRSRAPLKKYGARVLGRRAIWRPSGPIRTRPGHESVVPADTSSHATPPGGGASERGAGSVTEHLPWSSGPRSAPHGRGWSRS